MNQNDFAQLFTEEGTLLRQKGDTVLPWDSYPRPLLKRDSFFCLNGAWRFREKRNAEETVLVPFPPESLLSGIGRRMGKKPHIT